MVEVHPAGFQRSATRCRNVSINMSVCLSVLPCHTSWILQHEGFAKKCNSHLFLSNTSPVNGSAMLSKLPCFSNSFSTGLYA